MRDWGILEQYHEELCGGCHGILIRCQPPQWHSITAAHHCGAPLGYDVAHSYHPGWRGCAADPYSCCYSPTGISSCCGETYPESLLRSNLSDENFGGTCAPIQNRNDGRKKTRIAPLRIIDPDCSTIEPRLSSRAMRFGSSTNHSDEDVSTTLL